ncbi:hypothetical protein QLX08_001025 [Tetragonisca angustula]|uniref:Uncharacterized protein n=1 Tax=Tetragonisca angustula TaxID=166442 RepID=A0AAW1AGI3_9HYME
MPRFAKDSDEETDVKSVGRKTRAHIEAALLDSPLRRSTRNKTKQNESSPDSPVSDTGSIQITKIKKRGISAMDNPTTAESRRTLRSKINSVSSDINELPGSDVGTPTRKTRNNALNDSNKVNTRRSKCFTRANSEAKSPPTTRVRRTRASSIEPEAMTSSKLDKHQSELISTPTKTRRRASMLPSEATVLEEKECKKIAIVTLDRTLSNVIEIKETEAETVDKIPQKNESLSTSKNELDASQKSIDEKHLEDNVQEPYISSSENLSSNSSNNVEDVEKNVSADNKKISDNDKNALESSEISAEIELSINSDSKIKDMSIEIDLKLDDSNNSIKKHDNLSNKENLTTNIDIQDTKNATSSTPQTSKSLSVSDEETSKYSWIETNISPKRRHSIQLLEMSNENVSIKKVNDTSDTVNSSVTNLNVSTKEGDKSDNIQKLVVNQETEEFIIGSLSSQKLDKTSIQISISSSSNDSIEIVKHTKDVNIIDDNKPIEIVKHTKDVNTIDDNKPIEIGTELNETEKMCINESKENVDIEMNTSNLKEDINENKSEENNTSQCVTSGQCDTKNKNDNLNISEDVHEKDEMSCTELITFSESSNIDSPNSADVKLISNTQCSIVSKHKNIHCSQKNETDNLSSNNNNLLKSSDTHTNLKDSVLNNINENNVSNVIKSSDSSIVTETPAELVEEMSKRGEHSKNVSAVDDCTDSLTLKKQCENKLELSEKHSDVNQVVSKECQENMKIDDNDSDTNMTNVFQDILASEWKGKDNNTKPIHLNSTESEGECDLILVDREAWLAAENLKTSKETNTSDYDSDDTVVSKAFTDFMKARKNESKLLDTLKEEYNLNDSQDKSSSAKKRKIMKENKNRNEEGNTMEDTKNITQDVKMSINVDKNVSLTKNSDEHSTSKNNKSIQKSLENERLSESYKVGEKNLSLNEHKLSEDIPKSLNKSIQKEETNKLGEFNKETVEKRNSLNKSNCENVVASAKKDEKDQLLNISVKKKIKPQQLNVEIAEESDNELKKAEFRKEQNESDESKNISDSDDSPNKSSKIPTFLFRGVSDSSDDNDESNTIDSDIKMEYNFDGLELPDDDVPGDECRASETESSDSNDNGSDLADFVVDDDDEDEDEEEIESEEVEVEIENDLNNKEDVKEDEKETEEIIQEEEHENDNKNIDEKDKSKLMDTSNIKKNKSRKSNDLNISQTIGSDKKKKKLKIDTSQTEKNDEEDSYTNLFFETEQIKQKQDFGELVSENVEKLLNESRLSKVEKIVKSMECSTPKINISKQEICGIKKQDSSEKGKERNKNLTFKKKQNLKKLDDIKVNESLTHRSLPSELIELTTETNLSRPMSSKILELNKEALVSKNKTTFTTKCLKKEKLNESAPTLKLDAKSKEVQLIIASNSSIQNDQNKTENENKDKQKMKATSHAADVNDSLKRKLLKVAGNILESDRHKKHKKRKQLTFEETPNVILSRNDFKKDSSLTKTIQQFVPITNIDNNEIEKENKKKKKKKKERDNIDVQIREKINKEIETKPESRNKKIHDEVKKKKKKEKEVESISDFTSEKSKIIKKEKKISSSLSNECVSNEQPSKKKHKKQKLLIKDDVLQHGKVSIKKVPEENQILSSDILNQTKNMLAKKLSGGERKQLLESIKSIVSHKKQQLKDAMSDSDEGPETITFSKARDDAMEVLKRTADSIKANKEMKKKKQKEHTEKMRKQKEIKIKELESKNQIIESSKMEEQGKGVKRLADDVLDNLSDVPLKSMKKRRISEESSTFSSKPTLKVKNMTVEDDFLTLPSCSGSTTQFSVIDIQTIKKSKKIPRISSFREKMLARNSRQPVSAYLMYLKKQETLGKQKFYNKPLNF